MKGAFWYLLSRTFVNALRTRIARLRKPKYAIGAIFGVAYFYFYFYRFLFRGDFRGRHGGPVPSVNLGLTDDLMIPFAALILLAVLLAFAWLFPASRAALFFTEAEMAWLLPGPVTRTQLIRYKLLKSQLGLLMVAVLMTLLTGRVARDGHAWIHTLGWWLVFATIQLHRLGASFALTRLMERGMSNWVRRAAVLAIAGAFIAALIGWQQQVPEAPKLYDAVTKGELGPWLAQAVHVGPAQAVLAPFRLVVAPWFAQDGWAFLMALGPALLVLAAHYVWVIRSDVAFEEASVQLSEVRAKLLAARRSGEARFRLDTRKQKAEPVFRLAATGWTVPAFVWKSLLQAGGRRRLRIYAIVACVALGFAAISDANIVKSGSGMLGFIVIVMTMFAGPQITAQLVRQELAAADVYKVAPVRGWQVVLGQLLGPSLRWSALQAVAVMLSIIGLSKLSLPSYEFVPYVLSGLVALALVLPPFNVVAALVPSGMMLLFPGWWRPGEMKGVEASGMGIVMVFVQILSIALSLVVPAVAGTCAFLLGHWLSGVNAGILAGAVAASAAMSGEAWLGTLALGSIFERFDSSEER